MKMKKMHLCYLNLRNFTIIQKLKKMKNNSLKFLKLHIMNFENDLERDLEKRPQIW